jgi:2-methylcitrate dehydratase
MSSHDYKSAQRPQPDELLVAIADYAKHYQVDSGQAYETAKYCLMDTLACGFQALKYPACTRLLGPVVPGATMPAVRACRAPSYELDPVMGAFSIGAMVRWLDFNDTWLAAEWGHPSDNLGAILSVADYLSRRAILLAEKPLNMRDVLTASIKAHEIQGVLALENSFNRVGPRPRIAGARGLDGDGHADARRLDGADRERALQRVDRRRELAHLSPRAEHRIAQELGRG